MKYSVKGFPIAISIAMVISLTLLIMPSLADQLTKTLHYSSPEVVATNGYHQVTMNGFHNLETAGAPSLPTTDLWFVLPPRHHATSYRISNQIWQTVPGQYLIEPSQQAHRLSDPNITFTEPDPSIYQGNALYPTQTVSDLSTHLKRGIALATCLVHPVRWNPVDGSLQYLSSAELTLSTSSGEREETSYDRYYRGDQKTFDWVAAKVNNPEILWQYPRRDDDVVPSMLIVTSNELLEAAEEYASWHNTRGTPTYIQTVDNYLVSFNGEDEPERIRNGIISAYSNLNINYLLLLGDTQHIPPRLLFGEADYEGDEALDTMAIPADYYYSALDGNWNADDDTLWGEPDEADLMAEITVGRIPADNQDDVRNMLRKIQLYSDRPVLDDVLRTISVGEDLGWNVWGGDYMDEVYGGSQEWGRFTLGYNNWFHFYHRSLYDRNDYWSPTEDLAPLISDGAHFIHHMGHANENHVMKFDAVNDEMITNDGIENGLNITYTQGCYAGNFELDGFAEQTTVKMQNGSVAFIGHSRFGWGSTNNTNGPSQHFHREFVDAMMGEHLTIIGEAQEDSKEDMAAWFANNGLMRWCYYAINLLGDPALDAWSNIPTEINPEFSVVIPINFQTYNVKVDTLQNAKICLSRGGEIISIGFTEEGGNAIIDIPEPIIPTGSLTMSITAHNRVPFKTEIFSISDTEGFPWVEELQLIDHGGIEDGQANPGETVEVNPYVHNLGNVTLRGLTVIAETSYPGVRLINSETRFEQINSGDESYAIDPFIIEVDTTVGDMHGVNLILSFEDIEGDSWIQEVVFNTHAPVLSGRYLTVMDNDGNYNGHLDPGEEAEILFSVINNGSGRGNNIVAELSSDNPFIEVLEGESRLNMVAPNVVADFNLSFRVRVSEDCPNPYRAVFYVSLVGDRGLKINHLIDIPIGGTFYNFDRDVDEWEHEPVNHQFGDQWHLSRDNHTYNGQKSIKAGHPVEGMQYAGMLNSAMYMPEFVLEEPLEMLFWHKIDAEASRNYEGFAYDGGWVEIRLDHRGWNTLYPGGGGDIPHYPYEIRIGARTPLTEGQPVYSGNHDWTQAFFDLSEFVGHTIEIRFRFGSDEGIGNGGWWIDDIEFRLPTTFEAPTDLTGDPVQEGTLLSWSTPILPRRDNIYQDPDVLIGYRVYRHGDLEEFTMLDTLVTNNEFLDNLQNVENGEFSYYITSEYITGESDHSNSITIDWANSTSEFEQPLPTEWAIVSTFPNPFNSTTRIAYTVPEIGMVSINVFDISGRLVRELYNATEQPGNHEILFEAFDLPSGMYLFRMETPLGFMTAKMMLIR